MPIAREILPHLRSKKKTSTANTTTITAKSHPWDTLHRFVSIRPYSSCTMLDGQFWLIHVFWTQHWMVWNGEERRYWVIEDSLVFIYFFFLFFLFFINVTTTSDEHCRPGIADSFTYKWLSGIEDVSIIDSDIMNKKEGLQTLYNKV